ncbi:MAG TPA: TIGR03032 family protein, partial [Nocardioides sp.]|nr:TIGR03032 family protein [Nocardioides sp.]
MIESPVFVVAPPGAGGAELAAALSRSPDAVALQGDPYAGAPTLHPRERGWDSARLGRQDVKPAVVEPLHCAWAGHGPTARLVGCWHDLPLQVAFLAHAFPTARFVYVDRDPAAAIATALDDWHSRSAVSRPDLPDWTGDPWSLALTPGWRTLADLPLPAVVAEQWRTSTEIAVEELAALDPRRWTVVRHADLLAEPEQTVDRVCAFAGLASSGVVGSYTGPAEPGADGVAAALDVLPREAAARTAAVLADRSKGRPPAEPGSPFRSTATTNFATFLAMTQSSILVSTYQTGRLLVLRERDGELNTHFRSFESPMGIAYDRGRLAMGTKSQVWTFADMPRLAASLEPKGRHDAAFAPRNVRFTGDIRVHDIGWAQGELWAVATRFSTLVTFDEHNSFVPRWRPPFITELAPEDRCHLNGLCVIDDRVKYVTMLGTSNEAGGWRPTKAKGGAIMDVESNEYVTTGLSMPHSPRWHDGRLWVLESGEGGLCTVDIATGEVTTIAQLPGFTR